MHLLMSRHDPLVLEKKNNKNYAITLQNSSCKFTQLAVPHCTLNKEEKTMHNSMKFKLLQKAQAIWLFHYDACI